MLDIARRKPNGSKIKWVQSFAQNYQADEQFDLIIMTGHAFQTLLEDADIAKTFAVIYKHLKPDGRAVLESRNPRIEWEKRWSYDMSFDTPYGIVRETRHLTSYKNERMEFELHYQFPEETLVSKSDLRFMSYSDIKKSIERAGLQIQHMLGDWHGNTFDETSSEEMIFTIQHNNVA